MSETRAGCRVRGTAYRSVKAPLRVQTSSSQLTQFSSIAIATRSVAACSWILSEIGKTRISSLRTRAASRGEDASVSKRLRAIA